MSEILGNSQYGTDTLEVISEAKEFNQWMYQIIKPHCCGNILEIGSGIGNISQYFIEDGAQITLSDIETSYFPLLKDKFAGKENYKGIYLIDLSDKNLETKHTEMIGAFDTIFALNVVEHILDHEMAMKNAKKMLRPGGKVVILVPAFQWLFNGFDEQLDHHRRYTQKSLTKLLEGAGFKVIHKQYYNAMGVLGWYVSGNILKKKMIPGGQMKLYNSMVPLWKVLDFFTQKIIGLSVVQVGLKSK